MANYGIFKPYDVRGKYPQEINEKIISDIISALTRHYPQNGKIIIGSDARLSSPKLYNAAIKILKSKKMKLIDAGLITTPMLYFLASYFKADLGIMITASHNPKEYNGLKIVGKNAIPISGKEILKYL